MTWNSENPDPRKEYWNEDYLKYWQSRVSESGKGFSSVILGDPNTEHDSVYDRIFALNEFNPGTLVDIGCAWGRTFPLYIKNHLHITGIDISPSMIDQCKLNWQNHPNISSILESSAESLPFPDSSFDNLSCLAVFDATFQEQSISEFIRVTKQGAKLYITGKNSNYHDDDQEALNAEIGARRKGHPNFFTDVPNLCHQLRTSGHSIKSAYYFERRGDFAKLDYKSKIPNKFYEFFLVIQRGYSLNSFSSFSDQFSATYRSLYK